MSTTIRSNDFATANQYVKYYVLATYDEGDPATNSTPITVEVHAYRTNKGFKTWGTGYCSCTTDGITERQDFTFPENDAITEAGKRIFSKFYFVKHNGDGSKTLSITATFYINAQIGTYTNTFTFPLPTIPLASVPTFKTPFTMGESVTIKTNRASSSFLTSLYYVVGDTERLIQEKVSDTAEWDTSALFPLCPDSAFLSGTILARTYSGEKQIGSDVEVPFGSNVPDSPPQNVSVSYTIDNSVIPTLHRNDFAGTAIQGISRISFTVNATPQRSATIAKYIVFGKAFPPSQFTVTPDTSATEISVSVEDSRGFTTTETVSLTVYPYSAPAILPKAGNNSILAGRAVLDAFNDIGRKLRLEFQRSFSPVGGINKSTVTCRLDAEKEATQLLGVSDEDLFAGDLPGHEGSDYLSLSATHTVVLTIEDSVGKSHTYTVIVPVGFATWNLGSGGRKIGIGKFAEHEDGLDVDLNVYLYSGVKIKPSNAEQFMDFLEYLYPPGIVLIFKDPCDPEILFPGTTWNNVGSPMSGYTYYERLT